MPSWGGGLPLHSPTYAILLSFLVYSVTICRAGINVSYCMLSRVTEWVVQYRHLCVHSSHACKWHHKKTMLTALSALSTTRASPSSGNGAPLLLNLSADYTTRPAIPTCSFLPLTVLCWQCYRWESNPAWWYTYTLYRHIALPSL